MVETDFISNTSSHTTEATFTNDLQVAVVIVNYNVKDFLAQCLASLKAALVGFKAHIIVVDNDSTDGSMDYVEAMFPDVECMRLSENIGFGRANNLGFDRAIAQGAEYILCLNPDTLVSEDTISIMADYMEANPDAGLAGCKLLNADGTFQLACRRGFPTPWASFCKVFGLQALFPHSPLFAMYNQTFRSADETYFVDAVCGAFMFIRREALQQIRGFDEDFFMYGEDLDICYRVTVAGWRVAYVHTTSVIHYKGESTRRSALNEVRVFYEAMEIFARKHFGSSRLFLLFLRMGIWLRSALAYLAYYAHEAGLALWDVCAVNAALLLGTYTRYGEWLRFPPYAYPTVFVVVSCVTLMALLAAGEYSPYHKPSLRKVFSACMTSFFVLSALTFFFKEYAFSRGVTLLLTGYGLVLMSLGRIVLEFVERSQEQAARRIVIVGVNDIAMRLIDLLQMPASREPLANTAPTLVGVVTVATAQVLDDELSALRGVPIIGEVSYLRKIIAQYRVSEVIITDTAMPRVEMIRHIIDAASMPASKRATFRFAQEYDDVIASRILEDYTGASPVTQYNLALWQYRSAKRVVDVVSAVFLLSFGLPVVFLLSKSFVNAVQQIFKVLIGRYSLVGLYPLDGTISVDSTSSTQIHSHLVLGKIGLIGLAHIAVMNTPKQKNTLSQQAIHNLNEFYSQQYTLWLDLEIFMTFCIRRLVERR
jgi:GT2 family glycosyltransferase/lipopolysaccharide/colanic/teichoic acid biosynthesis glycosyltransferase